MEETKIEVQTIEPKARHYNCPGCGADLLFEPKDGVLACPYCAYKEQIPTSKDQVQELSYEKYLNIRSDQLSPIAENVQQIECGKCGASVVFTPPEVARSCSFCGAAIVMQPKSADPMVCPEAVLPFKILKDQASKAVRDWIASRWFAPDALKQFAVPGAISGVYIPFWTYDTYTTTHYVGQRGIYYYETETYTETDSEGKQVTRSRQVRKTNWYPAFGVVEKWFDDILIPATKSLNSARLRELEPWDLPELKPYDPAFLAGFQAQRYQLSLPDGFKQAQEVAAPQIASAIRLNIGGDEQIINSSQTQYSAITFKHILMPVYVGAYNFKQKVYQVIVNGRTGEVQGERPYSAIKIAAAIILACFVIFLLVHFLGSHQH